VVPVPQKTFVGVAVPKKTSLSVAVGTGLLVWSALDGGSQLVVMVWNVLGKYRLLVDLTSLQESCG
jgi:hypothetical protein